MLFLKRILSSFAIASVLITSSAHAVEVAGVNVSERISLGDAELKLNGAGVRSKFFMDLYVGSLYLPEASNNLALVLTQPSVAVRLNITSGMITSDKMLDAIMEGFDDATDGDMSGIQVQIDTFAALFTDEIIKGDQFTFEADKDRGVTAYKNGVAQPTIEGEDFREALLKIWLGDNPAQKSLRKAMLGG